MAFAAVGLLLLLGTLAIFISRAQHDARAHLFANFKLRGSASANLVGAYISQQAKRERRSAELLMAVPTVTRSRFQTVATAFGAQGAVLLGSDGRIVDVTPAGAGHVGESLTSYSATRTAERGAVAVSDVLPGPSGLPSIVTIGVPFESPLVGRRVFSAAYTVGSALLAGFVDHAIAYSQHEVLLADDRGELLAASPRTPAGSVWGDDAGLAEAISHRSGGTVHTARWGASTFTVAPVPGTPWRMVLAVPDRTLYASVSGSTAWVPWAVFGLVTLLGAMLLFLFARTMADRARLSELSRELHSIARTDALTGLANRRAVEEDLTRAFAHAQRRREPMTVLMIDLDRFKEVNDVYGHEAGDQVLVAVAGCLREVLRGEDLYGRLGGDEFVVAISGADEEAGRTVAGRLEARAAEVAIPGAGLSSGILLSVGVASAELCAPADLLRAADADLYRVKDARRAGAPGPLAATGR